MSDTVRCQLGTSVRRIVILDDHRDAADALARILTSYGFEVRTAYAAMAATQLARHFRPDAMVLDIGMPARDGYATARYVREDIDLHRALLIALTGRSRDEDFQSSREAGVDWHLVKPSSAEELLTLFKQLRPEKGNL